jgi:hypothetical protein
VNSDDVKRIEDTFRNSKSSNELFDAFQEAIKSKLCDLEIFKILIANPILSVDEIKMFTEKLLKETPGNALDLLLWTGKVLENHPDNYYHLEDTILIYQRAIAHKPTSHEPLLRLLSLYSHEIDLPTNQKILNLIDESIAAVDQKSKVYYALAKHYKKCGDPKLEKKYLYLAEESVKRER